jgi:uncharacterized protein (TIGR00369 family)
MTDIEATSFLHQAMPLCATLGITAREFTAATVALALEWDGSLCTSGGLLHGGAVMALADSAGGSAAFLNLPEGASGTSTIESKTNFLGSARAGTLLATARPLHVGSTTIVVETEVTNESRLVAKVTQTQIVLRPQPS